MGFGTNFSVSEDGVISATGAQLQSLTVYKTLTVVSESLSGSGSGTSSGSGTGGGSGGDNGGLPGGGIGPEVEVRPFVMPRRQVVQSAIMTGGGSSAAPVSDNPVVNITGETKIDGNTEITGTLLLDADTTI
jgi:hypothetical protein